MRRRLIAAMAALLSGAPAVAQDATALIERLTGPSSGLEKNLRILTDEIGGRVTGSANYEKALQWGVKAFERAGVDRVALESYPVPAQWEAVSISAAVVSPSEIALRAVSLGLAPSTPGPVTAAVVDVGEGRRADFDRLGTSGRGAIALVHSKPMNSFDDLFAEYMNGPETMRAAADHGLAAILFTSTRPRDLLYRHTITWGPIAPIPMAQLAREDGLRLARLFEAGAAPRITLDIRNRVGGPGEARNVVAEIRGAEKAEEIVLLGAHLDAWDLGTGALDNGVNCALVVDVARAIAAGPRPTRTIRFVLFTGEETGLLGSYGYVHAHRAELDRHVAVLIHDIGDGKVTGYFTNGRPDLAKPVQKALAPVAPRGAGGVDEEALLGTDNFDFLLEGVPNLVANQDTSRYLADYHAESDTFDKVDLELARANAAVAAVAVLGIANAPGRLGPRQTRAEVARILADDRWRLGEQMKTYGIWAGWEDGTRGREK
ncbi:MAG TPA: M28 family peptidase [Thermoanaerobaculia bacterium]|nr:M28 family peptidase [Thermoanaerobaculia bacterium]